MTVLVKTVSVLDMTLNVNDTVTFGRPWWDGIGPSENESYLNRVVVIDRETWDDLGQPQQITIRIEPGDLLND